MSDIPFSQLSSDELILLIKREASDGQLHLLSEVLQAHNNRDDLRGLAVVHAAKKGHLEVIQELLKKEISQEDRGEALINAAREGHLQVAQELLKNKALITPEDWKYALRCAVENEHLDVVHTLAENVPISNHYKVSKYSQKRNDDLS
jgi:ankyrin repeat protein